MQKNIVKVILGLVLICCIVMVGLWLNASSNTLPSCSVVGNTSGGLNKYLQTLNSSDHIDIQFEVSKVQDYFQSKATENFGTRKDFKCPESLVDNVQDAKRVTKSGKDYEIIYKKTGDYSANIGVKIDGQEYYQ